LSCYEEVSAFLRSHTDRYYSHEEIRLALEQAGHNFSKRTIIRTRRKLERDFPKNGDFYHARSMLIMSSPPPPLTPEMSSPPPPLTLFFDGQCHPSIATLSGRNAIGIIVTPLADDKSAPIIFGLPSIQKKEAITPKLFSPERQSGTGATDVFPSDAHQENPVGGAPPPPPFPVNVSIGNADHRPVEIVAPDLMDFEKLLDSLQAPKIHNISMHFSARGTPTDPFAIAKSLGYSGMSYGNLLNMSKKFSLLDNSYTIRVFRNRTIQIFIEASASGGLDDKGIMDIWGFIATDLSLLVGRKVASSELKVERPEFNVDGKMKFGGTLFKEMTFSDFSGIFVRLYRKWHSRGGEDIARLEIGGVNPSKTTSLASLMAMGGGMSTFNMLSQQNEFISFMMKQWQEMSGNYEKTIASLKGVLERFGGLATAVIKKPPPDDDDQGQAQSGETTPNNKESQTHPDPQKDGASLETAELPYGDASHNHPEIHPESASHCSDESHETVASQHHTDTHKELASHLNDVTHSESASQIESESHRASASQTVNDSPYKSASLLENEALNLNASQSLIEDQCKDASLTPDGTQFGFASQDCFEPHSENASQYPNAPHQNNASQYKTETHRRCASLNESETLRRSASNVEHESQNTLASQTAIDPQFKSASHQLSENPLSGASQVKSDPHEISASHDEFDDLVKLAERIQRQLSHKVDDPQNFGASHSDFETQPRNASQSTPEAQIESASHKADEPQRVPASQAEFETHEGDANNDTPVIRASAEDEMESRNALRSLKKSEAPFILASHKTDEDPIHFASHTIHETQKPTASLTRNDSQRHTATDLNSDVKTQMMEEMGITPSETLSTPKAVFRKADEVKGKPDASQPHKKGCKFAKVTQDFVRCMNPNAHSETTATYSKSSDCYIPKGEFFVGDMFVCQKLPAQCKFNKLEGY
jgi:hypothetical protein